MYLIETCVSLVCFKFSIDFKKNELEIEFGLRIVLALRFGINLIGIWLEI